MTKTLLFPFMSLLKKIYLLVVLMITFWTNIAFADDIGINSARLTQLTDSTYLFEADFNLPVILDFEMPIFPDRFRLSEPEFVDNAGLIAIKIKVSTSGKPLNYEDEILLPWRRNGVSLTVQWINGSIHQGLFQRSMDGIHVPLKLLSSTTKTMTQVVVESLAVAVNHFRFGYIHLLLILSLVFFLPKRNLFISLGIFAFGQAVSMLLFELDVFVFDLLYVDLLLLLMVITVAVTAIKKMKFNYLLVSIFFLGLFHGLAVGNEIRSLDLSLQLELISMFTSNFVTDLIHFGLAIVLILILPALKRNSNFYLGLKYLLGTLAVALILGIFTDNVLSGKSKILFPADAQNKAVFTSFAQQNKSQVSKRPQAALTMTNPVLSYISIEPFEVRHEILITVPTALGILQDSYDGLSEIPVDSLVSIQERIITLLNNNITLQIDDREVKEVLSRADFVTLGLAGVLLRPEPVKESIENGIIGVSFVYGTKSLANNISLNWDLFSDNVEKIEASTIDPFGSANFVLTKEEPELKWKSTMSGYTVPKVEEIAIESPRLSLVSFVIFILAIGLLLLANKLPIKKYWAFVLFAVGFAVYPFVRSPLDINFVKQWKPSSERSMAIINGLLTNVYRSFDYRNESDVYDRLSISVVGDQLAQIYIEQRKGLEIENRGGAKAKVNDVEVLEVYEVKEGMNKDFGIEVSWKINGSVSHFGHMHYRQNQYRAVIWITPKNGYWKIENIEMLDEERLM